jgi:hypothetical protein
LKIAVSLKNAALEKLKQDYTQYLGSIISNFIKKHNIKNLTQFASRTHCFTPTSKGLTLQIGKVNSGATKNAM